MQIPSLSTINDDTNTKPITVTSNTFTNDSSTRDGGYNGSNKSVISQMLDLAVAAYYVESPAATAAASAVDGNEDLLIERDINNQGGLADSNIKNPNNPKNLQGR